MSFKFNLILLICCFPFVANKFKYECRNLEGKNVTICDSYIVSTPDGPARCDMTTACTFVGSHRAVSSVDKI